MGSSSELDYIVVGAGIAGASVAAQLAARGRVLLLDMESHAGYHSTGRSAATFSQIYGSAVIRALSRASRSFMFDPPEGFTRTPLVRARDSLFFARPDQLHILHRLRRDPDIVAGTSELTADEVWALAPLLQRAMLGGGALEQGSADIDVDALHQGYLRQARARGAKVLFNACVTKLEHVRARWQISTGEATTYVAPVVVNAAGAWGDVLAGLAGVAPVGLKPLRRTAMLIDTPVGYQAERWPACVCIDESFYFKPDAGLLLLSPANEDLSPPCDAQPEEIDVAIAVSRFEEATGIRVPRVKRSWAGLRVFSPDRSPIVGYDTEAEGFFWLVGQGGYGIQTSAAMGRVAAALVSGEHLPADVSAMGVAPEMLSPARFAARPSYAGLT